VETRQRGHDFPWKPTQAVFGTGRWRFDTAAEAEAEVRLWSRFAPVANGVYELRIRSDAPAPDKTPEQAKAEQKALDDAAAARAPKPRTMASAQAAKKR